MSRPEGTSDKLSEWHASGMVGKAFATTVRTRIVQMVKWGLMGFAALLTVVVLWMAFQKPAAERFTLSVGGVESKDALQPVMMKPRFQGVDAEGQPFTVTADRATQQDANNVRLFSLQADLAFHDGTWASLMAGEGKLNADAQTLYIEKEVQLFHDSGYNFTTESATLDMENNIISGTMLLEGRGVDVSLKAGAFEARLNEHHLRFTKGVKLIIYPGAS